MKTFLIPSDFSTKNQEHVQLLQQALITLDYANERDFASSIFNDDVKSATQSFREDNALPLTNSLNAETVNAINRQLETLYRVCGELKDTYNMPIEGAEVIVSQILANSRREVGHGKSLEDGTYRVYLDIDDNDRNKIGLLRNAILISIVIKQGNETKLIENNLLIQGKETIFNFSSDSFTYKGKSVFESLSELLLSRGISLEQSNIYRNKNELANASSITGIEIETLMKLSLAKILEMTSPQLYATTPSNISAQVFFGFLHQGIPANMPSKLFDEEIDSDDDWSNYLLKMAAQIFTGLCLMPSEALNKALLTAYRTCIIKTDTIIGNKQANTNISMEQWINQIVEQINSRRGEAAYNGPLLEGDVKISDIINTVDLLRDYTHAQLTKIATLFVDNLNDFDGFIDALDKLRSNNQNTDTHFTYGNAEIDKLILAFQLSRVTRNWVELINILIQETSFFRYGIRFISTFSLDDWHSIVSLISYPPDFESSENYAQFVYDNAQRLYPELATVSRLESMLSSESVHNAGNTRFNYLQQIKEVLLENKDLDILTNKINEFSIDETLMRDPLFVEEFKKVQRVHRISPSPQVAGVLLMNGITNAAQVYYMGQENFAASFEGTLSQPEINNVYAMSTGIFASAITAFANINRTFNIHNPYVLPQYDINSYIENLQGDFPDIEQLFGIQDFCECDHDSSVFSPAAYLTEILQFLEEQKILARFKERRADICKINLSRQNTQTLLPYIDLVCEVLEEAVIQSVVKQNQSFVRPLASCQSTLSTEELCAAPEHIISCNSSIIKVGEENNYQTGTITAYDILNRSMFPMFAHLNLRQTEIRSLLSKMGVERYDLMELFQKESDNPTHTIETNTSIAAEYFGLTNLEQLVVTAAPATTVASGYSLNDRNEAWKIGIGLEEDEEDGVKAMPAKEFLLDTRLAPLEVLDILRAGWIGFGPNQITQDCLFQNININGQSKVFDRAHRFIRLYRKSEWKIWELNLLLSNSKITGTNNDPDNLNGNALHNLRLFSQQQKTLGLSCESMLAFFDDINRNKVYENGKEQTSLYEKLFLNHSVKNPFNSNFQTIKNNPSFSITDSDDELASASLPISKEDYDLLKSLYKKYTNTKNLSYLSYVYRHAILSNKLKVTVSELIAIIGLLEKNILEAYTLSDVDEIITTVKTIKESNISVFEYEYLARYGLNMAINTINQESEALALYDEELLNILTGIEDKIVLISRPTTEDFEGPQEPQISDTNSQLNFWQYLHTVSPFAENKGLRNQLIAIIEGNNDLNEKEIASWLATYTPKLDGTIFVKPITELNVNDLITRYNIIIDHFIHESDAAISIQNYIAKFFDMSSEIVGIYMSQTVNNQQSLLEELLTEIDNYKKIKKNSEIDLESSTPIENIRANLTLLHKVSLFTKKCDINPNEFVQLIKLQDCLEFDWYNFLTNYSKQDASEKLKIKDFLKLVGIMSLHKMYDAKLLDILTGNMHFLSDQFIFNICKLAEWNINDFNDLISSEGFNFVFKDFCNPATYSKVERCMNMLARMKVPASSVMLGTGEYSGWHVRETDETREKAQNEAIRNTAKALYDNNSWLKELTKINKPIREAKADALSSYLIAVSRRKVIGNQIPIKDKTDLFNYFLLDTEMSADVKTSRIVQATCSVQLFAQRIFLNLETVPVTINEAQWKRWEWMKRYRLWEAGFKVFLYPENYIEPELRDDKSPFFKEMEDELNQSDITQEYAETVFENYLQKLHEVSNLMVVGIYEEKNGSEKILHVVGRSRSMPYQYYYRNYIDSSKTWTHWEKIELEIKGEMVVPMVFKRKLHLFWINAVEKTINNSVNNLAKAPDKYTEIQLEWSVLKNKKWSSVKSSKKKNIYFRHSVSLKFSFKAKPNIAENYISFFVYAFEKIRGVDVDESIIDFQGILQFCEFRFDGDVCDTKSYHPSRVQNLDNIIKNLHFDENPKFTDKKDSFEVTKTVLLASRLYKMNKIDSSSQNTDLVYLHVSNAFNTPNIPKKFLSTSVSDPNFVQMIHDTNDLQRSLAVSHYTSPFFYQDAKRSFFVLPSEIEKYAPEAGLYTLHPFYHQSTEGIIEELNKKGISGIMDRDNIQLKSSPPPTDYSTSNSNDYMNVKFSHEILDYVDFSTYGTYSQYNWELFFHAPLYIACKLSQNQKYEEAMQWFHYIFNPTDRSEENVPQKFWVTKPFFHSLNPDNWKRQMELLLRGTDPNIKNAISQWLNDPFNPHLVARTRFTSFQKTVVMKYINNLISWADHLFRQDTMESNNEAAQLYILAYQIMGKKPVELPSNLTINDISKSYEQAKTNYEILEHFSHYTELHTEKLNEDIINTDLFPLNSGGGPNLMQGGQITYPVGDEPILADDPPDTGYLPLDDGGNSGNGNNEEKIDPYTIKVQEQNIEIPYISNPNAKLVSRINSTFCVPYNDQLLRYWDVLEDRLFKLRNSMNIEGMTRELPLFAPPIDPALLVRATAAGLSIADAMNEINAPQPYYRFRTILQKAIEFTGEVKQLGEKLLSALEKRDAEALILVRGLQEVNMQLAVKQVRQLQIAEAKQNIEVLIESIKNTEARQQYYGSKLLMNKQETDANKKSESSVKMNKIISGGYKAAAISMMIADFGTGGAGAMGSPFVGLTLGGTKISNAANAIMAAISQEVQQLDKEAGLLLTKAGYIRRKEEWDFQAKMAGLEIKQLNKQLIAAEIRLMVAEKELENVDLQIEQSQSINEFYKEKFTNQELYNWMITEISKVYLDAYQLAFDMAKKAELCYRKELGIYGADPDQGTPYIQFGHWDSLKQGLLSGDKLMHALRRLDAAYINKNKRSLELTKHISLAKMFPKKLLKLITEKSVEINLKEFIFDMDYPGHYMRRIKSVSVTIPNVAEPNTTISFMLNLVNAKVRLNPYGNYDENPEGEDPRFNYQTGGDTICTSSAQNDSGMFELNFGDERYLPFENAGAISKWKLSFPAGCNQFDISSVSDVILHINYTAQYGGDSEQAEIALQAKLPKAAAIIFSLKHDFPDEWNKMLNNTNSGNKSMNFDIKTEYLPFFIRGRADNLIVNKVSSVLVAKENELSGNFTLTNINSIVITLDSENEPTQNGDVWLYGGTLLNNSNPLVKGDNWSAVFSQNFNIDAIEDIIIGFGF